MSLTTVQNKKEGWAVPWIHQGDWEEMLQRSKKICTGLGESRAVIMQHVDEIKHLYDELDGPLNQVCGHTCPACRDVCCTKATVWYDQRDIIIYYLAIGSFPEKQITRSGAGTCCQLGEGGCRLPRLQRPFICTWYICSAQADILSKQEARPDMDIKNKIKRIKEVRKRIGELCSQG